MTKDHGVKVTGYALNMAGWTAEKASRTVAALGRIADHVRADPALAPEAREALLREVREGLHCATKLVTLGTGAEWTIAGYRAAFEGGESACEELLIHYGAH